MIHKINVFLLSLIIAIMPAYVYASSGLSPWSITNTVAQGASTILTGSKEVILNGAKKIATGTATITPTVAQVSKVLARGAAGYALSVAVEQLLGAVDWVLDPANNRIVYNETATREVLNLVSCEYKAKQQNKKGTITFKTEVSGGVTYVKCYANDVYWDAFVQGTYDSVIEVETEEKTLPLDTVAAQVISNAESGDTNAQVATSAAAADIINEAENDNVKARPIVQQLENTQSIPTDQTAQGESVPKESENTGDSTAEPVPQDITLDFPIFCDWAPSVCQAAKEVIALPTTLTEWWTTATQSISAAYTDAKEWFKTEPELEDSALDIQQETVTDYQYEQHVSFGASCPFSPQSAVVDFGVGSFSMDYDFTIACDIASDVRPYVVSISHLAAIIYLVYAIRNGNG